MMTIDMTAELAPVIWGMLGILTVCAFAIVTSALPGLNRKSTPARHEGESMAHRDGHRAAQAA